MDEYIKREMALEAIDEYFRTTNPDDDEQIGVLKSRRIIRTLPAADVAPVRHGRWIEHKHFRHDHYIDSTYECSECNVEEPLTSDYCPNCGAKMNEEVISGSSGD